LSDITLTATNANSEEFQVEVEADAVGIVSIENASQKRMVADALRLLPSANSIVVLAMEIFPEILDQTQPERITGHVSMNDLFAVHLDYINSRLTKVAYDIAHACRSNDMKAVPLSAAACPTDIRFLEAVFSYKHAAQAAGLGYIGRNSLLLTHDFGPRVRLSCCLTEAKFKPLEEKAVINMCTDCSICIKGCPSAALQMADEGEVYSINKFACSAFRSAAGGCSECMRLCPASK